MRTTQFAERTIDLGADGFLVRRPEAVELIEELGRSDELEAIDAPGLARRTGAYLAQRLEALAGVASVRGKGLLLAAVLEPGLDASEVARSALRLGLVLNAPVPGVLRLAPPLTVSTAEVDQAVGMLGAALESVSNVGTREGGQK